MLAYAPTAEVAEGQKTKYVAALKQHRSISARSGMRLRFNQRECQNKEKRRGRRGGTQQGVIYGQDVFDENGKPLLGFAEDNKLAL